MIFVLSFTFIMLGGIPCFAEEAEKKEDKSIEKAKSAILMCIDTGDIIYEKNAYEHCSPASVTKVMSILLVLEAIDSGKIALTDSVAASENAVAMGGSQIWLEVGEKMTVDELLKAVVVASANDACTALGEYIAGSDTSFVKMMNDKAKELGLENSNFENCTGLDDTVTNHYSCAYDIAVIAKEVMKHEAVKNYTSIWLDSLRDGKTELNNTNKLVNTYKGITGLKTGTTSNAGFCLCATAERDGMSLVSVVLGCETSDERFDSATNLLDFGFANYELVEPQFDKSKITDVKIKNGIEKSISPSLTNAEKILVAKGSGEIEYTYEINAEMSAPINKGDKLGTIVLKSGDEVIKTVYLKSDRDIEEISFSFIFSKMLKNI